MKKLLSIITFLFVLTTQSYSQNCNPNEYNDGMMIKEYEAEYNYKAEEAYLFGKKIQKLLLDKDLKGFIDVTTGNLKIDLENRFKEIQLLEAFFSVDTYNKITKGKVYCKPMGISGAKTFWIGLSDLVYTLKDGKWLVTGYKNQDLLKQQLPTKEDSSANKSDKEITYGWFKNQNEYTNANQLILNDSFEKFLTDNITSKKISLGMSRGEKVPVLDSFLTVLGGPPNEIVYAENNRYMFTSACRHQSCDEKGFLFIDTQKEQTIGLIRHFFINGSKFNGDADFLIFSKNHKSFDELPTMFTQMVKYWLSTLDFYSSEALPKTVRFIGSDNKIIDVTKNHNADFSFNNLVNDYSIMLEESNETVMLLNRYPSYFDAPYSVEMHDYSMFEFTRIAYINAENNKTPLFIQPSNIEVKGDYKSLMQPTYQIDNVAYEFIEDDAKQTIKINSTDDNLKIPNIFEEYFKNKKELTTTILSGGVYASSKFLPVTNVKQLKDLFKDNPQTFCRLLSEKNISGKINRELKSDLKSLLQDEFKKCEDDNIIINIASNKYLGKDDLPELMCSQLSNTGEAMNMTVFDLTDKKKYEVVKISDESVRFRFSVDKYYASANFDRFTNKLRLLIFSDREYKNLEGSEKYSCENESSIKNRIVRKSEPNLAWNVDSKFIIPECFDTVWLSGDNYEVFYEKYIKDDGSAEWDNKNFQRFVVNIGKYLNKEIPLNHSINPGWSGFSSLSLTKSLKSCLSEKAHTDVKYEITTYYGGNKGTTQNDIGYEVIEDYDVSIGKKLAPHIKQQFESIKKVSVSEWGGGSMGTTYRQVTYGVISIDGQKVLLPLKNHINFN
jgi:hypothetical protein